jgi:hypothetical protein
MTILFLILTILFFSTSVYLGMPWIKRKYSIRRYRDEYLAAENDIEVIYTDDFGNRWMQYKNVLNLPSKRAIAVAIATRMAKLGMTEKSFDEYTFALKQANNAKDTNRIGYLVGRMEERRALAADENTIVAMADGYFFLEGENPKTPSAYWLKKKKEIWAKDDKCYAFFLHKSFSTIRDIKDHSEEDFLHSLTEIAVTHSLTQL